MKVFARLLFLNVLLLVAAAAAGCSSEPIPLNEPVDPAQWITDPKTGELVPAEEGP